MHIKNDYDTILLDEEIMDLCVGDISMKKFILSLLVLLIIPTICMARKSVPFMTGVIVNNQNEVVAVQVNSPAYNIGIRPLDKITKIVTSDNMLHTTDIKQVIDKEGEKTLNVEFLHKQDTDYVAMNGIIQAKKLNDAETRTTFLVVGNEEDIFKKIIRSIKFDPKLSLYLPMQNLDSDNKFITVYSSVDKHGAKDIGSYVTRFPSSAVKNLETQGTIVVGDTSNPNISMVKVNLAFKVSWDNFFSKGSDSLASSGVMERLLVERLYSDL